VLILISSVNWSIFSALSRRGLKAYPASQMIFYVMTFGWLFTSVLFIVGGNYIELPQLSWNGWIGVAFLGVFCSGLAYIAWYDALHALPTAVTGAFLYIEPLVAMIVAFFVLDEAIIAASLFGGAIILFGVWLVNKS
jgi:drug/metabolite transporter (DMT)-like permease